MPKNKNIETKLLYSEIKRLKKENSRLRNENERLHKIFSDIEKYSNTYKELIDSLNIMKEKFVKKEKSLSKITEYYEQELERLINHK